MTIDLKQAIRVLTENRLSFPEAARKFDVHVATIDRWRLRGIRGVTLETALLGGKRVTSEEALDRFLCRVNEVKNGRSAAAVDGGNGSKRQRAIEAAERELDAAGI